MTTEEMQKQIESMMPTPKQIVEHIDKNLRNNMAKIMKAEQYINDYTRGCSNELSAVEYSDGRKVVEYHDWLTPDQALRAAEIAKEETIEKAVEWIKAYIHYDDFGGNMEWLVPFENDKCMIQHFKIYMEE